MTFRIPAAYCVALIALLLVAGCTPAANAPQGVYLTFDAEPTATYTTSRDELAISFRAADLEGRPLMPRDLTADLRLRGNGTQASLYDPAWVDGAARFRIDIFHASALPANNTVFVDIRQAGELKQTVKITVTPAATPTLLVDGKPVPLTVED